MYERIDSFCFCWQLRNSSIPTGLLYVAWKLATKASTRSSHDLMEPFGSPLTRLALSPLSRAASTALLLSGSLYAESQSAEMTYYVMFEGRVPGVYEEWEDCKKQVHKFSGNCYKGYPTRHEAVAKWRKHQSNKSKMKMKTFLVLSLLLTIVAAVLYFILV
ncbi:hypothetical protein QYE76_031340 [Lolium multiflorum]|uniref:Ribonuclease H1 N-terminal domain-containing protein n=1 Tax=Lolium multiflorum TaxID=4521 RepID=A0AAD8VHC5_LOLMU|nr:hypothetical protein QYE76_031340 [Lolium multiflorum]